MNEETRIKLFWKRLKFLYKKIDQASGLHLSQDKKIPGKKLRSETGKEDINLRDDNKIFNIGSVEIGIVIEITLLRFRVQW